MERKLHYKLHKVKKQWVTIAVSSASLLTGMGLLAATEGRVSADEVAATAEQVTTPNPVQSTTPPATETGSIANATETPAATDHQNTAVVSSPLATSEPVQADTTTVAPVEETAEQPALSENFESTAPQAQASSDLQVVAEADKAAVTGFHSDDQGNWYYADQNGQNVTGLKDIDGAPHYFYEDGKQAKGVDVQINDKTYYFDQDNGHMWKNRFRLAEVISFPRRSPEDKWVYYGADGARVTGKQIIDGNEYYFSSTGQEYKGKTLRNEDDSVSYYDKDTGIKVKNGWGYANFNYAPVGPSLTYTMYFDADGKAVKGFKEIDGKLYHFTENGYLIVRNVYRPTSATTNSYDSLPLVSVYNGKAYTPDKHGVLTENTEVKNQWVEQDGQTYYVDADGKLASGLQEIDGKTYYFGTVKEWQYNAPAKVTGSDNAMYHGEVWFEANGQPHYHIPTNKYDNHDNSYRLYFGKDGSAVSNQFVQVGDVYKYFGKDGKALTGLQTIDGKTYYFTEDGSQVKGKLISTLKGERYYLDADSGETKANSDITIDGVTYHFDQNGLGTVTNYPARSNQLVFYRLYAPSGSVYSHTPEKAYYKNPSTTTFTSDFYYFDESGKAVTNRFVEVDGNTYYFGADGRGVTGNQTINGQEYIFNPDGTLAN